MEEKGYEINPYDPCVANKIINGSQHTVIWHVDDLKCSHKKAFVNTKFATWLGSIYGKKLTVKRGKTHDYLGMDLDWSVGGKVTISMIKYVYKILEDFIEVISRKAATPARANLFQVQAEELAGDLPEELAVAFHHAVAQLLFLSLRARRNIQLPTAFLTKRVKKPNRDDWGKLLRVLEYLNGTKHVNLTLEVYNLSTLNWLIGASHQVHENCKGHTGGALTPGKGVATSSCRGQKPNTKSSTETELVGTDDLP